MTTDNNDNVVAGTWSGALTPPDSIPDTADVVIIGGGIVGVSTAWFLARQAISPESNPDGIGAGCVNRAAIPGNYR